MVQKNKTLHSVGAVLFTIAILLGILVTFAKAWPDLESALYGFSKHGYRRLTSLHCPVLMTSRDSLPVTIRLTNPLDQNLTWYVRAQLSTTVEMITQEQTLELQPHEDRTLAWEVNKDNVDLHNFILAYAFSSPFAGLGMTEGTCGTLVLNVPLQGGPTIYYASLAIAVVAGVFGFWLWLRHADMSEPAVVSQSWWMRFLALLIALGIVTSILGWWIFAIVLLVLTMLTLVVSLVR